MKSDYYYKGYWCWHFQREILLLLLFQVLLLPELLNYHIIHRDKIILPSKYFSDSSEQMPPNNAECLTYLLQSARERCMMFYLCFPLLSSCGNIHVWLTYAWATHSYVLMCICGCSLFLCFKLRIWPLVAISRHLCFHAIELRTVVDRWYCGSM